MDGEETSGAIAEDPDWETRTGKNGREKRFFEEKSIKIYTDVVCS